MAPCPSLNWYSCSFLFKPRKVSSSIYFLGFNLLFVTWKSQIYPPSTNILYYLGHLENAVRLWRQFSLLGVPAGSPKGRRPLRRYKLHRDPSSLGHFSSAVLAKTQHVPLRSQTAFSSSIISIIRNIRCLRNSVLSKRAPSTFLLLLRRQADRVPLNVGLHGSCTATPECWVSIRRAAFKCWKATADHSVSFKTQDSES